MQGEYNCDGSLTASFVAKAMADEMEGRKVGREFDGERLLWKMRTSQNMLSAKRTHLEFVRLWAQVSGW